MVPSSNQKGNFVTFEGDDCKEDKLGLSKDVLGRRRKRRGIKIHENIVKKSIHQLQVDPSMFDKVQNKYFDELPNAQQQPPQKQSHQWASFVTMKNDAKMMLKC